MSRIRIKNFGPIKEGYLENDGWMDIKKVTVFIGNQGSGKSTVAKLISTLSWLEKSINMGDINKGELTFAHVFEHFKFQGIRDYFLPDTSIEYQGDKYLIELIRKEKIPIVREVTNSVYIVPKIIYIPAERNFLSTIEGAFKVTGLPDHLFAFAEELKKAQKQLTNRIVDLPIYNYSYEYDKKKDISYIKGRNHMVNLLQASSGFQSIVPLFLVTRYLARLINKKDILPRENMSVSQSIRMNEEITSIALDKTLSEEIKQEKIKLIQSKFVNQCLLNIVEEPEQNLYPTSQRTIVNSLLKYNNLDLMNKLLITTHSPYILSYITLAVKAHLLKNKLANESVYQVGGQKLKLSKIVPLKATIKPKDIAIYEFDELKGCIIKLGDFFGIPSDKNYLNLSLAKGNELYDQLLEIEEEL